MPLMAALMLEAWRGWRPLLRRKRRRIGTAHGGEPTLGPWRPPLDAVGASGLLLPAPCMRRATTDLQPSVPRRRLMFSTGSMAFYGVMEIAIAAIEPWPFAWTRTANHPVAYSL